MSKYCGVDIQFFAQGPKKKKSTGEIKAMVKQINYPASSIGHQNCKKEEIKNYSTEYSHVVPHHSTDSAINCLTAQIGRDAVGLVVYGRSSKVLDFLGLLTDTPTPFHQDQDQD